MLTLRAFDDSVLRHLKENILELARKTVDATELELEVVERDLFPATWNDGDLVDLVKLTAGELGHEVIEVDEPFAWSEDFGHFSFVVSKLDQIFDD